MMEIIKDFGKVPELFFIYLKEGRQMICEEFTACLMNSISYPC